MKKTLIFCLVGLMIVSLCACGSQKVTTYSVEIDGKTYHAESKEEIDQIIREHTVADWGEKLDGLSDKASNDSRNNKNVIEVVDGGYDGFSYGYHHFYFKVRNISRDDINTVRININILDDNGDIVNTTHPQEQATLKPGQSICIEALAEDSRGAVAVVVDSYSLYDAQDNYYTGTIDNSPIVKFEP